MRNMVVREAVRLAERQFTFEDEAMEDEPENADEPDAAWEAIQVPKRKRRSVYDQARRHNDAKKTLYDRDAVREEALDAISELEALWNEGYLIAAHLLGKAYRDGLGIKADAERAVAWFRKSAEAGNDFSGYALGKLLLEHEYITEGVEQMERAAAHGNQYAQYRMGKLCLAGEGVAKNMGRALEWLKKSAAQGNQYAQYMLGKLYLLGEGVEKDREKATAYLTRAAAWGNVYAQYYRCSTAWVRFFVRKPRRMGSSPCCKSTASGGVNCWTSVSLPVTKLTTTKTRKTISAIRPCNNRLTSIPFGWGSAGPHIGR